MTVLSSDDLTELVAIANRMADAASVETLTHFRSATLVAENKEADGFDPVTIADQAAEEAMRRVLAAERPEDGVFGEETERTNSRSGLSWILDPIDGTRAFISGVPVWGTLIALDDGNEGRIGIIEQPFTDERFIGVIDGDKSWASLRRGGQTADIQVRRGRSLSQATLFTTDADIFTGDEIDAFQTVRAQARLTRYGTDCYAYAMLAMGQIDLVIESGLAAYDIASHVPLIRAAGGIVTDWQGGDCRWGGRVIASATADLHAEVLEILSSAA